jgi:hypothetical protein
LGVYDSYRDKKVVGVFVRFHCATSLLSTHVLNAPFEVEEEVAGESTVGAYKGYGGGGYLPTAPFSDQWVGSPARINRIQIVFGLILFVYGGM